MLQVVAAILQREGRILICRRRPDQSHPLKWEFPGGKVEPGESPEQALARELDEELGIHCTAAAEIARYEYTYPGKNPIELIFLRAGFSRDPENRIFHEMRWEHPARLGDYDFLDGDVEFLKTLTRRRGDAENSEAG